jgi:hypothetical protein
MNFDAHKSTIGYGLLAGIQGEQDAHQEEKPHQIKVVRVEGRATLYWRALAKNQRKKKIKGQQAEVDHAWQPAQGIDLLRNFDWPDHLKTNEVNPIRQAELDTLEVTKGSVLQRHAGDPDIDEVRESWIKMLEWVADPPRVSNSDTWLEFQVVFNLIPSEVRATKNPDVCLALSTTMSLDEREADRELMAGIPSAEADVGGELAAQKAGALKKATELAGPAVIEVAQHPEAAMGHGSRKARVRTMEVKVGSFYIGLTTTAPHWCCFKLIERLPDDMLKIWWWGNRTVEHVGPIWALRDKIEGTEFTIIEIELATVAAVEVKWVKKKTLSDGTRKAARLAGANWVLSQSSRKQPDRLPQPHR